MQYSVLITLFHGFFNKEVYMKKPNGFVDKENPHLVCILLKAIYSLNQAPRAWFHTLSSYLLDIGFTASLVDISFIHIYFWQH
jgi:hypothetical protein